MSRNFSETLDQRMFDFKDFYKSIARIMPHNAVMAEVGVAHGTSAIFLAEEMLNRGKEKFKLYLIDDLAYGAKHQLRLLTDNVVRSGVGPWVEIVPEPSVEAACHFPDNHFHFVFIDASHKYEWTKADIIVWNRKVIHGYPLAGHDYLDNEEVRQAVDEIIPEDRKKIFSTLNDHGVWKVTKELGKPLC